MHILIINGCWTPNIGNAFVNIGLEGIIKKAFPLSRISYSSNINNRWFFSRVEPVNTYTNNAWDITSYLFDVDIVVWGGMMLTKEFTDVAGQTFLNLSKRGIPLLFLGAGGDKYDNKEVENVVSFFNTLNNFTIITRDDDIYNLYENTSIKNSLYKGIDSAFFLPEAYKPPKLMIPEYDVECFDRIQAPRIEHYGRKIVISHHDVENPIKDSYVSNKTTLLSELPYDYLTLYANVNTTYSERVHACIATLAYGNKAMLFSKTPRKALFNKLLFDTELRGNICEQPISLNMEKFQEIKENEIELIKKL